MRMGWVGGQSLVTHPSTRQSREDSNMGAIAVQTLHRTANACKINRVEMWRGCGSCAGLNDLCLTR